MHDENPNILAHFIEFELGQILYLKTDPENLPRQVAGIVLRPENSVMYFLVCGTTETLHYPCELTDVGKGL